MTTRRAAINVYTVLMLIALIAFGVGVGFMWMENTRLTEQDQVGEDNPNPWYFVDPATREGR